MNYSEEKLSEIFTSLSGEEPLLLALFQVIDTHRDLNKDAAFMPNLAPEDRAYNCGRCASLEDLVYTIRSYDKKKDLTKAGEEPTPNQSLS